MGNGLESGIENVKMPFHGSIAVKVKGRVYLAGNSIDGDPLAMKHIVAIPEKMHDPSPWILSGLSEADPAISHRQP
jgi:hypothetical protein